MNRTVPPTKANKFGTKSGRSYEPFSLNIWTFGDVWCRIWLAVDVWMCTASILNLCAISLDRFVAVTRPITYPNIMSKSRAKMLVGFLWVLSFVICLPPLVGWKDSKSSDNESNATLPEDNPHCPWTCELINESGYVVYSALGSFYIPMFVMLFFYWRIYRAAIRTTQAINQGFKITGELTEQGKYVCFQTTSSKGITAKQLIVKRFRMETKAAKTLGIIVGGFIFCWLPFFTMYLVRAFCKNCINPLMFSILFWLGYCNSAINPLIYALFSKDFRFAFKRIICKCFCTDKGSHNSRRGSEGSQLQVSKPHN
ncbi:hypothetical protein ABEB36_008937 [Hypothenemus hampei]|uniref:G-protein coupled receptors family 1 profile domain-containing protein n=1 Tax=Hypothenemus hampei TaxID=57062 RepID=A0ABD1ENZ5_HYPHA